MLAAGSSSSPTPSSPALPVAEAPELLEHGPLLVQLERARTVGFLGPGPVAEHITHTGGFLAALAEVTGTVVDLGSGGGVPGLVIGVARPDLTLVLLEATAKRCRFLEAAVQALGLDARVVEGRAEVLGHGDLRGTADGVVARSFGAPAATAECAAPLLRLGGILVVSEPPAPAADRWPPEGLALLGLGRGVPVPGIARDADPGADGAVPGQLSPPRRAAGQAAAVLSCSTWNTGRRAGLTPGREFHVEHRPRSLRRAGPAGRMHAVSDPSDDLATRGRAIFQRLRGAPGARRRPRRTPPRPRIPRRTHRTPPP